MQSGLAQHAGRHIGTRPPRPGDEGGEGEEGADDEGGGVEGGDGVIAGVLVISFC